MCVVGFDPFLGSKPNFIPNWLAHSDESEFCITYFNHLSNCIMKSILLVFLFCLVAMVSFAHTDSSSYEEEEIAWLLCTKVFSVTVDGEQVFGLDLCLGGLLPITYVPVFDKRSSGVDHKSTVGISKNLSAYSTETNVKDQLTQAGITIGASTTLTFAKNTSTETDDGSTVIIIAGSYPVDANGKCTVNILYGHENSTIESTPRD